MTDEELAEITLRDQQAGTEPWTFSLSVEDAEEPFELDTRRRYEAPERLGSISVSAGKTTVLVLDKGANVAFTEPHLSSWHAAIQDRRDLLAEVERLQAENAALVHGLTVAVKAMR